MTYRYRDRKTGRFVSKATWLRSRSHLRGKGPGRYVRLKITQARDDRGRFLPKQPPPPPPPKKREEALNWIELWDRWSLAIGKKPIIVDTEWTGKLSFQPDTPLLDQSGARLQMEKDIDAKIGRKSWQVSKLFGVIDDDEALDINDEPPDEDE